MHSNKESYFCDTNINNHLNKEFNIEISIDEKPFFELNNIIIPICKNCKSPDFLNLDKAIEDIKNKYKYVKSIKIRTKFGDFEYAKE